MALNSKIVSVTQPGATGNQATTGLGFTPKAIIAYTTLRTADGAGSTNLNFGYGFATYRSSTVAQYSCSISSQDNAATSVTTHGANNDALLRLGDGTGTTVDFEVALVSLDADGFTLNWVNLSSTASALITVIAIGGSDLEDALAGTFTTQTTPADQDVTVVSGFGQPSAVLCLSRSGSLNNALAVNGRLTLGFGIKSGSPNGRSITVNSSNSSATQASAHHIDDDEIRDTFTPSARNAYAFTASSSWPTDGFRVTYSTQTNANPSPYLALKFSSACTVTAGGGAAPTAAAPQTTTLTSAGTPILALLYALRATADGGGTFDQTGADVMMFGVGAIDASNGEAFGGGWDDDAQATASVTGTVRSTSKAIAYYDPSADTITSEADGAVNGSNFDLTWGDTDASAFKYHYLTVGIAGSTTVTAGNAAATGAANNAAPAVGAAPTTAAGTGASPDASRSVAFPSEHAAATGAANNAAPAVGATSQAGPAEAAGVANQAAVTSPVAAPSAATATGAAYNATIPSQNGATAAAAAAGGDGAALDAGVLVRSTDAGAGGWRALKLTLDANRWEHAQPQWPVACPHCGEPWATDSGGKRVCRFDGYAPDGRSVQRHRLSQSGY